MNCVTIKNLSAGYDNIMAIEDISLVVPEGVRCAIVGPNGAGKTTLLKAMLNLESKKMGDVTFWGEDYAQVRNKIAYVSQRKMVDWSFPITVYDAVLMGAYSLTCTLFSHISAKTHEKVKEALSIMKLTDLASHHINNLSGGQQQRVFIARALVQQADLYILDEPLTGLDKISEKTIAENFFNSQVNDKTIIAVHHDWSTLELYFNWIIFLNKNLFYCGPYDKSLVNDLFNKTF